MTVVAAADTLARAGFVPDWGGRTAIDEERPSPSEDAVVTGQSTGPDGVVVLSA